MKKRDEGNTEIKEVYVQGQERTYCDGCGAEIKGQSMRFVITDFGDPDDQIPERHESWDLCHVGCFEKLYPEKRQYILRLKKMGSQQFEMYLNLRPTDLDGLYYIAGKYAALTTQPTNRERV